MELWNARRDSLRSCPPRDLIGSTGAATHPLGSHITSMRSDSDANNGTRRRCVAGMVCGAVVFVAILPVSCAHRSPQKCFPGGGSEVWVERHYAPAPLQSTSRVSSLKVRLVPDSAGVPEGGWQTAIYVVSDTAEGRVSYMRLDPDGTASIELPSGRYTIRVAELTFVSVHRSLRVTPGERVEIELQRRRAAYCLGPVVRTGTPRSY